MGGIDGEYSNVTAGTTMTVNSVYLFNTARSREQIIGDARSWCGQLSGYKYAWNFDSGDSTVVSNGRVLSARGLFEPASECPRAICVTDWDVFSPPQGCECELD